jgi:hypothetical protein
MVSECRQPPERRLPRNILDVSGHAVDRARKHVKAPAQSAGAPLSPKAARDRRDWHLVFPCAWSRPVTIDCLHAPARAGRDAHQVDDRATAHTQARSGRRGVIPEDELPFPSSNIISVRLGIIEKPRRSIRHLVRAAAHRHCAQHQAGEPYVGCHVPRAGARSFRLACC